MVFRGLLLNITLRDEYKWSSVLINAGMFLLIHFPIWIYNGELIANFKSLDFFGIIILSVIFSWTFIKSRNIFVPILLHMFWDLLVYVLY